MSFFVQRPSSVPFGHNNSQSIGKQPAINQCFPHLPPFLMDNAECTFIVLDKQGYQAAGDLVGVCKRWKPRFPSHEMFAVKKFLLLRLDVCSFDRFMYFAGGRRNDEINILFFLCSSFFSQLALSRRWLVQMCFNLFLTFIIDVVPEPKIGSQIIFNFVSFLFIFYRVREYDGLQIFFFSSPIRARAYDWRCEPFLQRFPRQDRSRGRDYGSRCVGEWKALKKGKQSNFHWLIAGVLCTPAFHGDR